MRRVKKSETLEVRLPYEQKRAFMAACQDGGITASDAIRDFIDDYIEDQSRTSTARLLAPIKEMSMTVSKNPRKTGILSAGLGAGAMLLLATPSAADEAVFERYDANDDGTITLDELTRGERYQGAAQIMDVLDLDESATINEDEFKTSGDVTQTSITTTEADGDTVRTVTVTRTVFDLKDDEDTKVSVYRMRGQLPSDASEQDIGAQVAELQNRLAEAVASHPPIPPTPPSQDD